MKRRGDVEAEAVDGPPQEAPVARNEKGRPEMAPGSPGTRRVGMTTGKIRTAGAGETPARGTMQTRNGDLRNMKNTKKLKKKKRTGKSVKIPARGPTRTSPLSPPRAASHTKRTEPKRSRSTQVSDEFVRRQQEAAPPQAAPPEDLCATQIQRLHRVVELLEQLAQPGLPTLLSTFYRSGDFTAHHKTFHDHPSTAEFPRVGN